MIIELVVGSGLVIAGVAAARLLVRRRRAEPEVEDGADAKPPKKPVDDTPETKKTKPKPSGPKRAPRRRPSGEGPRGLRVDDVLLYADTELWLAGMIALEEEDLVARLFVCPGSTRAEWIAQLDEHADDIALLMPSDDVVAGSVPDVLPVDGRRLTLERRGRASVSWDGESLPKIDATADYVLLSDAGGRVVLVLDFERAPRIALKGDRVSKAMIDLLPGGDLDD